MTAHWQKSKTSLMWCRQLKMLNRCNFHWNKENFLRHWGSSIAPKGDNPHFKSRYSGSVIWLDRCFLSTITNICHFEYSTYSRNNGSSLVALQFLKHGYWILSSGNTFREYRYVTNNTLADMLFSVFIRHFYTPSTSAAFHTISK